MLFLLPPSETKRDGGAEGTRLDLGALRFPALRRQRTAAVAALRSLSGDQDAALRALKLGPKQHAEVDRNRSLRASAVMPAIDRYTGVLYDALDGPSLSASQRDFAAQHVVIHSALFGPIGALDPIPAYRLSHDSRLPDLALGKHWRDAAAAAIATGAGGGASGNGSGAGLVLDLRSEAYVHLGPAPAGSFFVRVVSEGDDGVRRALNHFNKKGKGSFVRAVIQAEIDHADLASLLDWAASASVRLSPGAPGELELVV
ncbi:peroxide stress protein YaaA [Salinibacterium sp. ZJ454]|uniref:YaaA family protein n=1 Tax=Salinibacterium sp. ZJ454 TaxID=2708339 RepID=UPI0014235401|nr:peroxide stress protein YaaA [Salinibacterium sp. ZJ454]